ncbi:MAG: rod shape-determining protein MreD [Nocardioidaceae bacterium]
MTATIRAAVAGALIVLTIALQVSVFSHFALDGVVPDLALLVVIAAALVRGPTYAALLGFVAGLMLDLSPPADHTAGRWALAFVVVGYLTGLAKPDGKQSPIGTVFIVAAGAFIGTSVYALTGIVLGDPAVNVASVFSVVPLAVGYDVLLCPLVIPLVVMIFRRLEPAERW